MKKKKRGVDEVPEIPEPALLQKIAATPEPYRSYACFCYLFGNRVSEGIGIPKRDIVDYYYYKRIGRKGKVLEIKVPKYAEYEGYELEPLKAWQIQYDEDQGILWARSIPTLKKPKRPLRDVAAIVDGVGEEPFIRLLLRYCKDKDPDSYLWDFSRKKAYNNFMKYLGVMPHKLRSLRATKDVREYELDAKELMDKYKWSNAGVALHYIQKNPRELIAKMKRKAAEKRSA